mmetsp:Transcript_21123/g.27094  ORF Transcript_21123/g.27094 Transcript_21123/m.27094 type:complete len:125 (+) Transcript_21123:1-375(+)
MTIVKTEQTRAGIEIETAGEIIIIVIRGITGTPEIEAGEIEMTLIIVAEEGTPLDQAIAAAEEEEMHGAALATEVVEVAEMLGTRGTITAAVAVIIPKLPQKSMITHHLLVIDPTETRQWQGTL